MRKPNFMDVDLPTRHISSRSMATVSKHDLVFQCIFVFGIALAARYALITDDSRLAASPHWDELYHIIAARSWAIDGTFNIAGGSYTRGAFYTTIVGTLFKLFGEDLTIVRLFSGLVGSLWVTTVFISVRMMGGTFAGWTAATLFAFMPQNLFLSQFIRFYSLHGLLFTIGATAIYAATAYTLSWSRIWMLLGFASVCMLIALHLQPTTIIGCLAIGGWLSIALLPRWIRKGRDDPRYRRNLIALCLLAILVIVIFVTTGLAEDLFARYRSAPMWLRDVDFRLYHWKFSEQIPVLWGLAPIAAVVAISRRPWAGLYCVSVFAIAFLLHTFAEMREQRYIQYAMPFFFGMWGIAVAELWPAFRTTVGSAVREVMGHAPGRILERSVAGFVASVLAVLFFAVDPAYPLALRMTLFGQGVNSKDEPVFWFGPTANWDGVRAVLGSAMKESSVVVVTDGMLALYYLGRYDYEVSRNIMDETDTGDEFGLDRRTGSRVVSSRRSVERLLDCFPTGLFIASRGGWGNSASGASESVRELIKARAERVTIPAKSGFHVYRWRHSKTPGGPACAGLPRPSTWANSSSPSPAK